MAVTFNGARLNSADSNTGWGNYNTGGGAPASEAANAYQQNTIGSSVGSVGKKVNSTTSRQGVDYNGANVDYTNNNYLWYCKVYVADPFDLNTTYGVEVSIGSSNSSNYHEYNIAGSGANNDAFLAYPARGGYLIVAIDPTIDGWAEVADSGGAFNQTQASWYAVGAQFQNGFAKSENVAMDAIDYGTGLTWSGSTLTGFREFVSFDQDDKTARYGVVNGSGNSMVARGILTIGDSNATSFTDSTTIVTFPDGYHSAGKFGVNVNLSNASSSITISNTIIGEGRIYLGITDTRPDFTVVGETGGTFASSANLRNFRNISYNSFSTITDADIQCQLLTQGGADISDTTIRTDSAANVACLQDPTFGSTTGLHDVMFIRSAGGHAIELDTATTYSLTNITFDNYGADASSSAAIFVSPTTGTVTINVNGGDTPTVRSAGASVVINNTKTVRVIVKDADTLANIQDARVLLEADSGGPLSAGTDILSGVTNASGVIETTSFNYTSDQPVTGRVRRATTSFGTLYKQGAITGTITVNGFNVTILLQSDE